MSLESIMLSEKKKQQSYKVTYCAILFIWHPGKGKTTVIENRFVVAKGKEWEKYLKRGQSEDFLGWWNCSVAEGTWIYTCVKIQRTIIKQKLILFYVNDIKKRERKKKKSWNGSNTALAGQRAEAPGMGEIESQRDMKSQVQPLSPNRRSYTRAKPWRYY